MPRYRRWRRKAEDPVRDLIVNLLALMITAVFMCGLFGLLSQPGAFKFTLGPALTPTPSASSPAVSAPGSSWIALLLFLAILLGGSGLVILSLVWFISWATHSSRAAPSTPPTSTPAPPRPNPPVTPTVNMAIDVTPIRQTPVVVVPSVPEPVVAVPQEPGWAVETGPLMTGLERSFFWALGQAVQETFYIFPQVPLRELVGTHQRNAFMGNLSGMLYKGVVDFLLVNPNTLDVAMACEFDDPSHRQADAQARDRRKEGFLRQIGIPLIRVQSNRKWNLDLLRQQVQDAAEQQRAVPFLDDEERQAFQLLREARADLYIFPRVPLNGFIRRRGWLPEDVFKVLENETASFLLAHPRYLGPMYVVEFNEPYDLTKVNLLKQAGVPILDLDRAAMPTAAELRATIGEASN